MNSRVRTFCRTSRIALSGILFCAAVFSSQWLPAQNGITWSLPIDIASNSFNNEYPRIALAANGNPLVVWGDLIYNKAMFSLWSGSSFSTPVAVNPTSVPVYAASWTGPDIASKGDTVYVVFKKIPYETNPSYIVRSFDGGLNFSSPVQVDYIADSISWLPTVTADASGNPLVAFMKLDSGFVNSRWVVAKSTDFGNTFLTDSKASGYSGGEVCDCCPGSVVSSSNKIAMLYRDNLSNVRDIWAGISIDNGNSFPSGINIDQNNWVISACPATGPDGIIVNDTLYSVYMSSASGMSLVYTNKNSLAALTSSTGNPITGSFSGLTQQNYPRISTYKTAVSLVWKQMVNGSAQLALLFTTNIHNGFPAAYDTVAIGSAGSVINADVAIFYDTIHVVWQDNISGTVKYRKGIYNPFAGLTNHSAPYPSLLIYPNPTSGEFSVYSSGVSAGITSDRQTLNIEVCDVVGKPVAFQSLSPRTTGGKLGTMNLSFLPKGVYFLKQHGWNYSVKLVKY